MYTSLTSSESIGERLRRDIGIDWLLTVTSSEEFLRLVERTPGQIWCSLWETGDSASGADLYDAVVYYKTQRQERGHSAKHFDPPFDRYRFRPSNRPRTCPEPEELRHLAYAQGASASASAPAPVASPRGRYSHVDVDDEGDWDGEEEEEEEEERREVGPGEVVVGALVSFVGLMAVNEWFKKREEEAARARERRYYVDYDEDDEEED